MITNISPTPSINRAPNVQWGNIELPNFLFDAASAKKNFISPAASFNPNTALQNNPWQSLTPPSATPQPKKLVLTVDIFCGAHTTDQWLAIIHWLEQSGFVIYLCTQDEEDNIQLLPANHEKNNNTTYALLKRLTSFNETEDYKTLAELYQIERKQVVVLDNTNLVDFLNCIAYPTRYVTDNEIFDLNAFMAIRPRMIAVSGKAIARNTVVQNPELIAELTKAELAKKEEIIINEIRDSQEYFTLPEEYIDEVLKCYHNDSMNDSMLLHLAKVYPELAVKYVEKHADTIINTHGLYYFLQSSPIAVETLLLRYPSLIDANIISHHQEIIVDLLCRKKLAIENTDLLALCVQHNPQQATNLLAEHADKIKNIFDLLRCCSALNNLDEIKTFILTHEDKFAKNELFSRILARFPRLFFWAMKRYSAIVDTYSIITKNFDWRWPNLPYTLQQDVYRTRFNDPKQVQTFIDRDLKQDALQYPKNEKVDQFLFSHISYLYLDDNQNLDFLTKLIKQGAFSNLIVTEISHIDDPNTSTLADFFNALQEHCPYMQRLLLPDNVRQNAAALPYSISYHSTNGALSNTLYIANGQRSDDTTGENSDDIHFEMSPIGTLLNQQDQPLHDIRTGILQLSSDLKKRAYFAPTLIPIATPPLLSDADITEFKKITDSSCSFYEILLSVAAGQIIRLLSFDAAEELIGITDSLDNLICFYRGNDDFFYCSSAQNCQLSYVIKVDSVARLQQKLNQIPDHDPIIAIINDYKKSHQQPIAHQTKVNPAQFGDNLEQWLEEIYKAGTGSCGHRCFAVWHAIKKSNLAHWVRLLEINNNHIRLEVYDARSNHWHQVELGGTSSQLVYNNSSQYQPTAVDGCNFDSPTKVRNNVDIADNQNKPNNQTKSHIIVQPVNKKNPPPAPETKRQAAIRALIYQHSKAEVIHNKQDIQELLLQQQNLTCLLIANDLDSHANLIIEQARLNEIPLFYLDKPKAYSSDTPQVLLQSNGTPVISLQDRLDLFLEKIKNSTQAIILVNWKAFSPEERIALNTLIDSQNKSVYGKLCPAKVISLYKKRPTDMSILTRHKLYLSKLQLDNTEQKTKENSLHFIDVKGYSNWQEYLFGPIILINNQLVWTQGPLTKYLLELKTNNDAALIEISNIPPKAIEEFNHFINEAKAPGAFNYQGYDINFPKSVTIKVNNKAFSFTQFPAIDVYENSNLDNIPSDCPLINTTLFDYLLNTKQCSDGYYHYLAGWLHQARNQTLSLFITTDLSINQWYCLLATATEENVTLTLYLAPGVTLPNGVAKISFMPLVFDAPYLINNRLYVCKQSKPVVSTLRQEPNTLCFAIDDYTYQDLIAGIDYRYEQEVGFYDFKDTTSDIIFALKAGLNIVLYGKFSAPLLQSLEPVLLQSWSGQLTLVIEDEKLNEASTEKLYPALAWLPTAAYQFSLESVALVAPVIEAEPIIPVDSNNIDLTDSEQQAESFIQKRCMTMMELLVKHRMLQLVGSTGVGKSYLMHELEKSCVDLKVYHELNQFEEYANNNESGQVKILFIDDVNNENLHFSMFEPCKQANEEVTLLYKGKFYSLTRYHLIVFARSNKCQSQNLFADGEVPEFHLTDLPPAVIFEDIIKRTLNSNQMLNREDSKNIALPFLIRYFNDRSEGRVISVFELQAQMMSHMLLKYLHTPSLANISSHSGNSLFVPTPSTTDIRHKLRKFMLIHMLQRSGYYPAGIGLNSFLIEGEPGNGKTESIRYNFECMGYREAKFNDRNGDENGKFYCKIDASLPLAKKIEYTIVAFERGWIIWLDELNSCLDNEFKKVINNALSGKHPKIGQYGHALPGFGLVVSINSIALKGRTLLDPALLARSVQNKMPDVTHADLVTIIQHSVNGMLDNDAIADMATDLYTCFFAQAPKLSLRFIVPQLKAIAALYGFNPYHLSNDIAHMADNDKQNILEYKEQTHTVSNLKTKFFYTPPDKVEQNANQPQIDNSNKPDYFSYLNEEEIEEVRRNLRGPDYEFSM